MRFYLDLDTLALVTSPTDNRQVYAVESKRGDSTPIEVIFVRAGIPSTLAAGSTLTFGAKEAGKYDGSAVIMDGTFEASPATCATATAAISSASPTTGEVTEISIVDGGIGYESSPSVTISGTGSGATATASITDGVISAITLTQSGSGYSTAPTVSITAPSTKYSATPSLNTGALNALFMLDGDTSNDVPYVDLMAEFSWAVGSGSPTSSKTFTLRVYNDVIRGNEGTPIELPSPAAWLLGSSAPINGTDQVITATATGTISTSGVGILNFVSVAASGGTSTYLTAGDTPTVWAGKLRTAMQGNTTVTDSFTVGGTGAAITFTVKSPAANDATMNASFVNASCAGITSSSTATQTTAGVAPTYAPPYIRVAGGYLYVQEAGVWKKAALSSL